MGSTKTENELNTLSGSVISVDIILFVLNSAQSSGENYLKESLSILCVIIQGKGSSWKRFDPEIYVVAIAYGNMTRLSFFSSRT